MDVRQVQAAVEDGGIVKKVDDIIQQAVQEGATEIHLEPLHDALKVRVRVDGSLRQVEIDVPDKMITNVINRVKVLSGMDITKTKIPQSGFFKLNVGEKKIEMVSNVLPTLYGEAAVIRVEYKQSATLTIDQLGMSPKMLDGFKKAVARDSGLLLITGPPGSGKRTTAYAAVLEVDAPDKLVVGLDPVVKYEVPGMIQAKVEEKAEFTAAEAIEALFKQEPDVAYIGDITCIEEARAAIQGAFARRIVLCRMTATDCVNAMQNFLDMGVQPFLVAASLSAITNQRLLRKLCTSCREPYPVDENLQKQLGVRLREGTNFYRPKGCEACGGTGYVGVQVIFELFTPSEELNKMVVAREPVQALRQQAFKEGMVPLKMDGIGKAMHGLVALEDVLNSL
jgi:type II secretory ATPase GspE/PulE/Tfp pilus assembly ATPase PilB-like protein